LAAVVSLYRFAGSGTGGIPGTVEMTGGAGASAGAFAGACARQVVDSAMASGSAIGK
jgi:hypothetical protein